MALPTVYNTGTASVNANGTAVTGQGTTWLTSGLQAGDIFWAAGLGVRIATVNSNTSMTLAYSWPGSSRSADTYEVRFTPDAVRILAASRAVLDLLTNGNVSAIAGLTSAANKVPYFTGAGVAALADFKAKGRDIVNTATMTELLAKFGPVFGGTAPVPSAADIGLSDGDFNTVAVNGVYTITGTWSNGPLGSATHTGILIVYARSFANHYVQEFYRSNGDVWRRYTTTASAGSWPNAWQKVNPAEYGSNANGEYLRFPDGTQICWGSITITPVANTWTTGVATFPAAFSGVPNMPSPAARSSVWGTILLQSQIQTADATSCTLGVVRTNTSNTTIYWMAIGRY